MKKTCKLKEISILKTGPFGTQFKASEYVKKGIPVINVKNIGYGNLNYEDLDFINAETRNRLSEHVLHTGDIVFGRKGSVDRHCLITEKEDGWFQGSDCLRVRITNGNVNPQYVSYYLLSNHILKSINHAAVGSTMASINMDIIGDLQILLPSYDEQCKIANILKKLDDKRDVNNHINDNLQQMAYDIYMHTFFKKKPNGKLGDILIEHSKSPVQVGEAKDSTGEYPFFTSGAAILKWDTFFVDGRSCFLNTGGNADVKYYVGKASYSTDTWCISACDDLSDYLYLFLVSTKPELNQKFFQGTGLKHLQKPLLKDRAVYIPEKTEIEAFNTKIIPMFNIISENTRENQKLIALRDWLLPMLMNGQATVTD